MNKFLISAAFALLVASFVNGQTLVFSDDFNRATLNPAPNGASYTTTVTGVGADGGASIVSNILNLTNDATATANANGTVSNAISTATFATPYVTTLSANPGLVTWNFNMQQIRLDPAGPFASGTYSPAFVLAGSTSGFTTGTGYAVVYGQSGAVDPVRLVSYSAGLGLPTNIITATGALTDIGTNYLSLRVTYDPATNGWELFGRDDGASAFADPTTGSLTSLGTATNTTFTGVPLGFLGQGWSYSTAAAQFEQFDNVSVTVVPEPTTVFAGVLVAISLLVSQRHRLAARLTVKS